MSLGITDSANPVVHRHVTSNTTCIGSLTPQWHVIPHTLPFPHQLTLAYITHTQAFIPVKFNQKKTSKTYNCVLFPQSIQVYSNPWYPELPTTTWLFWQFLPQTARLTGLSPMAFNPSEGGWTTKLPYMGNSTFNSTKEPNTTWTLPQSKLFNGAGGPHRPHNPWHISGPPSPYSLNHHLVCL